jgi:squalene synthase HpnC
MAPSLLDELAAFGPAGTADAPSPDEARAYCARLATSHYENFSVASRLLPRELRPHFYNVYAYCRWADDLADETGDPARSLELLDWWQEQLDGCYAGAARHPVFIALEETIREFSIPREPFARLLTAFRQDQTTPRYETFEQLLGYCRNSADPVGRLVLYLGRCHDDLRGDLSDAVCTGLQLANFWQDVARDRAKGRTYLPQEDLRRFGVDDADLDRMATTSVLRKLLEFEVDRADDYLRRGLPLVGLMPRGLSGDVWLFIQGGLRVLDKIRALDYDVLRVRPKVSKLDQIRLLVGCVWRNKFAGGVGAT